MRPPAYDLVEVGVPDVRPLLEAHHGYASVGDVAVKVYAVVESGEIVAAYVWNPPPYGAARAVAPSAPHGVLALTRMVAVPRERRRLRHISRPLRRQMRTLLDRGRWPALVTYSDEGQGHTGHVYRCSGWHKAARSVGVPYYVGPMVSADRAIARGPPIAGDGSGAARRRCSDGSIMPPGLRGAMRRSWLTMGGSG